MVVPPGKRRPFKIYANGASAEAAVDELVSSLPSWIAVLTSKR